MLVEKSLPSEIHGTVIAVLITGSVVLKAVMYFKRKKNGFPGTPCEENGCHQSSPREELVVEMRKGHFFLLIKEPRMYVIQAKMIFLMKSHMN